jgi:hypothetical protein
MEGCGLSAGRRAATVTCAPTEGVRGERVASESLSALVVAVIATVQLLRIQWKKIKGWYGS